jgi:hypothetical protein
MSDEIKKIKDRLGEKSETDLTIEQRLQNLEKAAMRTIAMVINIIKGMGLDKAIENGDLDDLGRFYT